MEHKVLVITLMALLNHMCLLACHPAPWRNYPPLFVPGPQFCPDTGRTVCTAVDYYPTDRIYNLLTSARSQVFNLTSLFVDERKGDNEPNASQLLMQPPYYQNTDGYGGNQPPPGGRFSPAGRRQVVTRAVWINANSANNDRSSGPPWSQQQPPQERWRQVSQPQNSAEQSNSGSWNSESGDGFVQPPQPNGYNSRRPSQPRIQNQRNLQSPRNTFNRSALLQNEDFRPNNPDSVYRENRFGNRGGSDFGSTFENQQQHNNDGGPNPFGGSTQPLDEPNWYHSPQGTNTQSNEGQGGLVSDDPFQIQAPQGQKNIKGHNVYERPYGTAMPQMEGAWKKGSDRGEYTHGDRFIPPRDQRREEPRFNNGIKRGKRNRDVEVACPVQSTYVPPRAALNDQSEWKYVVNVPERDQRFSQVVRVDICLTEGQPCSSRLSLPFGFVSRCRQKYIKKKLLSLNADGQGTGEDNFFIPSCCVCEIVRSGNK